MNNLSYSIIHYGGDSSCPPEAYRETHDIPTLEKAIELGNQSVKEGLLEVPLEIIFDNEWIEGFNVIDANLDELVYHSPNFGFNDLVDENGLIAKKEGCIW